ncbi:MAG: hypothetical protein R3F61_09420 [Myxococcota bacterium]
MRPIALLLALTVSSDAFALSCLWGVVGTSLDTSPEIPTNPVVLVEHTFDATAEVSVELRDATGAAMPVRIEKGHQFATLAPESPLEPGATYTLVSTGESEGFVDSTFTVGGGPDTEPPDAPTLDAATRMSNRSMWGDTAGIRVILGESWGAAWYEYEISTSPDFTDAHRFASTQTEVVLGTQLCDQSFPDYARSERYHVRARAVDAAGNASDWATSAGEVRGCSSLGAAGLWLGFPVGLLALVSRRKTAPAA